MVYLKVFWRTNGGDTLLNPPAAPSDCSLESTNEGSREATAAGQASLFPLSA